VEWLGDFSEWAWARHHNVLSWYVRPLFLLPFCYFAWRRSSIGIVATLMALATSMFWFPAPATPEPDVVAMLAVEREYLLGDWPAWKIALALLAPLSLMLLGAAFWHRSLGIGLLIVNAMALAKIAWSFHVAPEAGGAALLWPALTGLALCNGAILVFAYRRAQRKRAGGEPALS